MEHRTLGHSGLRVSVLSLGAAGFGRQLDAAGADPVVAAALEAGITFFDTAEAYPDSELVLGEVLRGRRDRVVLATKYHPFIGPNLAKSPGVIRDVRVAVEGSLRRLQTDRIDLYYLHQPVPDAPIEDMLGVLGRLVEEGKVRHIGASNLTAAQVRQADCAARSGGIPPFVAHQNHYSLADPSAEQDTLALCAELGLGFVAFAPLVRGLLVGRYRQGEVPAKGSRFENFPGKRPDDLAWRRAQAALALAEANRIPPLHLALGSLLVRPEVSTLLVGATSPAQVQANAAAAAWRPDDDVLSALHQALGAAA